MGAQPAGTGVHGGLQLLSWAVSIDCNQVPGDQNGIGLQCRRLGWQVSGKMPGSDLRCTPKWLQKASETNNSAEVPTPGFFFCFLSSGELILRQQHASTCGHAVNHETSCASYVMTHANCRNRPMRASSCGGVPAVHGSERF
jgi:hypothetical protein